MANHYALKSGSSSSSSSSSSSNEKDNEEENIEDSIDIPATRNLAEIIKNELEALHPYAIAAIQDGLQSGKPIERANTAFKYFDKLGIDWSKKVADSGSLLNRELGFLILTALKNAGSVFHVDTTAFNLKNVSEAAIIPQLPSSPSSIEKVKEAKEDKEAKEPKVKKKTYTLDIQTIKEIANADKR